MDKLSVRVLDTIRKEQLIPEGSFVCVGFSGGADSVCLLSVLAGMRALLGCELKAVHVHHGLRGEEADRDEAFCAAFCKNLSIPFETVRVDVRKKAAKEGLGVEEAARILRYDALQRAVGEKGLIAVAHHSDDQAETILLNLLRGSGLKGLAGMNYRRENIIRPLLDISREEILSYCKEKDLSFVTDSTNACNDYARNRIRNVILPELKAINPKAGLHLVKAGQKASQAEQCLEEEAASYVDGEVSFDLNEGCAVLKRKKLKELPQICRRYVIIETIRRLDIPLKDWGEAHFASVDGLLGEATGLHLDLPGGVCVTNTKEETIIRKGNKKWKSTK